MTEGDFTYGNLPKQTNVKKTTEEFIRDAILKHGNTYDYSLVDYKTNKTKVKIRCLKHGVFEQKANNHLNGARCGKCAKELRSEKLKITTTIATVKKLAEDKNIEFLGADGDKTISYGYFKCNIHSLEYKQKLVLMLKHINGCKRCDIERRFRLHRNNRPVEFLDKLKQKFGGLIECNIADYMGSQNEILFNCKFHGSFLCKPSGLLQSAYGCPTCSSIHKDKIGWSRSSYKKICDKKANGLSKLYVIYCKSETESFIKIGITYRSLHERFRSKKLMPYKYEVLYLLKDSAEVVWDLEKRLKGMLKDCHYIPDLTFNGEFECFTHLPKRVDALLRRLSSSDQLQLIA